MPQLNNKWVEQISNKILIQNLFTEYQFTSVENKHFSQSSWNKRKIIPLQFILQNVTKYEIKVIEYCKEICLERYQKQSQTQVRIFDNVDNPNWIMSRNISFVPEIFARWFDFVLWNVISKIEMGKTVA